MAPMLMDPDRAKANGAAVAAMLVAVVGAACAERFPSATLAIVDVNVIPMDRETVLERRMVVLANDRILAVEPSDPNALGPGVRVVPGKGRYLIPGLSDMHVHALSDVDDAVGRALPLLLANGVTTARDMGSTIEVLTEVRDRLASSETVVAPRLVAGGPLLDGSRKPWYGDLPLILESPEEVPGALARLREAGVDFYKVYDDLTRETYMAIVREAAGAGLEVAGHVPKTVPLIEAVEAGQRTFEHLGFSLVKDCIDDPIEWFRRSIEAKFGPGYDAYYDVVSEHWDSVDWSRCRSVLEALGRDDVFVTPTLDLELNDRSRLDPDAFVFMHPEGRSWCDTVLAKIDQADVARRNAAFDGLRDAFRRLRAAGVTVLAGSDAPNNCLVEGFSLHWELALLVEGGMTPFEALRAATVDAARALGRQDDTGTIQPGRQADLVLLDGDPLADIHATRSVAGVVRGGIWLERDELDALLVAARPAQD